MNSIRQAGFLTTRAGKLLGHPAALRAFAHDGRLSPITVQLAPTEACESRCTFCSFAGRDARSAVSFNDIVTGLSSFSQLGAQGLELTGGGNPLLYKCKKTGKDINDLLSLAKESYRAIGMITNGIDLSRIRASESGALSWVRISTVKFFEGKKITDIDLGHVDPGRVGFNFVCPIGAVSTRGPGSKITMDILSELISEILLRYPGIRFIRIVPEFARVLKSDPSVAEGSPLVRLMERSDKVFVDGFGVDDFQPPASGGCFIGGFKPFIASSPDYDDKGVVYICCCYSHFTNKRYDWKYVLCRVPDIVQKWQEMNQRMVETSAPYSLHEKSQTDWTKHCALCIHRRNNQLLIDARASGDRFIDENLLSDVEDLETI
jgi:hypothetical protein